MRILLLLFLFVLGCKSPNMSFVEKYGDNDFSEFKGKDIIVRGFKNKAPIIFYETDTERDIRYIITLSPSLDCIRYIKKQKIREGVQLSEEIQEKAQMETLVLKFIDYNIYSLNVDNNNNVLIKTIADEYFPCIIRFSDNKYKVGAYKNWENISNNWYEEIR